MTSERILMVEDDPAVAKGLRYALLQEGFEVAWAATGAGALEQAQAFDPHAILLDVRLPDISGFDVCRQLRSQGHRQPILMLTARDEESDRIVGLELGADDYVVKPYSVREVVSRVRAQLRRAYGPLANPTDASAGGPPLRLGEVEVDLERMQVLRGRAKIDLTAIEFRLLRVLGRQPGRPLTRDALLNAVWGVDADAASDRMVDVHICRLREKLEDDPAHPRWIQTVRGVGYKLSADGAG